MKEGKSELIEEKLAQEELEYLYKLVEKDYKYHTVKYDKEKINFVSWLMIKLRLGSWGILRFYKIEGNIIDGIIKS